MRYVESFAIQMNVFLSAVQMLTPFPKTASTDLPVNSDW